MAEAVDPIKDEVADIKVRILKLEEAPQTSSGSGGASGGENINSGVLQKQVDEIKENMKSMVNPTDPKLTSTTLVVGGLTDFISLEDASKWLKDILWDAYAPLPIETYVKGKDVEFSEVFCASFCSPADRIKSLTAVKTKLAELGGTTIWADTDLPATVRAPEKFLFALKKQLIA